jgi:hypothetical protein
MVETEVDGDMFHLLSLQVVVPAAVVAVVVSVGQAAVMVLAVVVMFAAEAETREAEWTEPTSQSGKYKPNA